MRHLVTALLFAAAAAAQQLEVVVAPTLGGPDRFDKPVFVDFTSTDPDMAYVVLQGGEILRVPRDGKRGMRTTFLDFKERVYTNHMEEGLLGFTFDPDYKDNRFVYLYYSERTEPVQGDMAGRKVKSNRQSVVSRFKVNDGSAGPAVDPQSELRVISIFQPYGNHNGGTVIFGPDKMLYIALGDGGAANDPFGVAQSKQSLLGKVLRIDVRGATAEKPYAIPADNPFVAEQGARGEIWCWGLRNPWRIAFDRENGDLWCGDVGQNRLEEVDRLVKGGNYGWNFMEADEDFELRRGKAEKPADLIAPVASYPRNDGISITGGYVYRGKAIPALVGWYVYADFATFRLFACKESRDDGKHQVMTIGRLPGGPSSFAEEPDGELLVTCFDGKIYRLMPK